MKILVVDDDSAFLEMLRSPLEAMGYECLFAENGQEAWEIFQEEKPRIILADWMMPICNGLELCEKVTSGDFEFSPHFVLMTGQGESVANFEQAETVGADDFLTKPIQVVDLRMKLRLAKKITDLQQRIEVLER